MLISVSLKLLFFLSVAQGGAAEGQVVAAAGAPGALSVGRPVHRRGCQVAVVAVLRRRAGFALDLRQRQPYNAFRRRADPRVGFTDYFNLAFISLLCGLCSRFLGGYSEAFH